MKILMIGSEFKPTPAFEGGAVSTLIDNYLLHNEQTKKHDITVYSIKSKKISIDSLKRFQKSEFRYIDRYSLRYNIEKILRGIINRVFGANTVERVYIRQIVADLRKRKELTSYDIIIVENRAIFTEYLKKILGNKIILHLHSDSLNIKTKRAKEIIESCKEIWCVSDFIKKRVEEVIDLGNAKILYNGVDLEKFTKEITVKEKQEFLNKYNLKEEDKIILYTGRLMPEKGVYELICAFQKLEVTTTDIKLLIVGGPKDESVNINDFVEKIYKMKSDKIIFTGELSYDDMPIAYNIADIQVVPSIVNEAFGLSVVEGMASSTALIVTNKGGIPEIVENTSIPIIDTENLTENISVELSKLLSDEELRKRIITQAKTVSEKFSLDNYNNKIDEYLSK